MRLGEIVLVVPDVEDALGGGRQPARRARRTLEIEVRQGEEGVAVVGEGAVGVGDDGVP